MDAWDNWALNLGTSLTPTQLILAGIVCLLAILVGVLLAKKQARAYAPQHHDGGALATDNPHGLPTVRVYEYGDMRFLHLGTPTVQGSMRISKPFDIHLEYVQRMMGWLLFVDLDRVRDLQAMQLGLGAASLTKFCHVHLHMHTTAVELNPEVISTCRRSFLLPENNPSLHVMLADAADVVADAQWHSKIDALQVDLSDQDAIGPALDSVAFYACCKDLLTDQGCMSVNLFGRGPHLKNSLHNIAQAFGPAAVWTFKPTKSGNTIALAFRTPRQVDSQTLQAQAQSIQARWSLPAEKWVRVLAPLRG
jgi:spermidine synthase